MLKSYKDGCQIQIKVIPKSSKTALVGWENEYLKIRLRALPEKGNANEALIEFLSELFSISKSRIHLIQGQTSRLKRIYLDSLSVERASAILQSHLPKV